MGHHQPDTKRARDHDADRSGKGFSSLIRFLVGLVLAQILDPRFGINREFASGGGSFARKLAAGRMSRLG